MLRAVAPQASLRAEPPDAGRFAFSGCLCTCQHDTCLLRSSEWPWVGNTAVRELRPRWSCVATSCRDPVLGCWRPPQPCWCSVAEIPRPGSRELLCPPRADKQRALALLPSNETFASAGSLPALPSRSLGITVGRPRGWGAGTPLGTSKPLGMRERAAASPEPPAPTPPHAGTAPWTASPGSLPEAFRWVVG